MGACGGCGADSTMDNTSARAAAARKRTALEREVSREDTPASVFGVAMCENLLSPLLRVIALPIIVDGRHWFQVVLGLLSATELRAISMVCHVLSRRRNKAVDAYLLCWECIEYDQHQEKVTSQQVHEQEQDALESELLHGIWAEQEAAQAKANVEEQR